LTYIVMAASVVGIELYGHGFRANRFSLA